MTVKERVESLQRLMGQSPLFKLPKQLPDHEAIINQLQIFRTESNTLLEKCYAPLKVVLMGEVKAGKSTLLNALAGDQVSPTNVTETTASIIEIRHANKKKGQIVKKSGETLNGRPEELYQLLDEHRGDQSFFSDIAVVNLQFPLPNLQKLHLVDTPGLKTVTTQNESITMEYIQKSDVVLWVFSAHHLGQWDIEEELANVKSYGKPIIAVINRLDEVDGEAEELEAYLDEHLGFFIDETFAVSAYQALQGIQTADQGLFNGSRFSGLISYMEENIDKQSDQVQEESLASSIEALADKEKVQHEIVRNTIDFQLQSMDKRKGEIKYHNDNIKRKVEMDLQRWILSDFLDQEKRMLLKEVEGLGKLAKKSAFQDISDRLNNCISSGYITNLLDEKFLEVNTLYQEEWKQAIETIGEKISMEEKAFQKEQESLYEHSAVSLTHLPQMENAVSDGAKKGAAIGGAYGFAAATYSAVLGPSAAAVSMGTALSAIMPPVLIVGAVTGIAVKLVMGDKKKREFSSEIANAIDEVKQRVTNVFIPAMKQQIESQSNKTANDLYNQICEFMSQGWTEEELMNLNQTIKAYDDKLTWWQKRVDVETVASK